MLDYQKLFKTLYQPLCYFAFRALKDKIASEDVVQDCFVKLWERRSAFLDNRSAKSYLYTLVYFRSVDYLGEKNLKASLTNLIDTAIPEISPENAIIAAETHRSMEERLKALPGNLSKVVNLIYVEGKSYKETAKILETSINTIKKQRAKGIEILRRQSL